MKSRIRFAFDTLNAQLFAIAAFALLGGACTDIEITSFDGQTTSDGSTLTVNYNRFFDAAGNSSGVVVSGSTTNCEFQPDDTTYNGFTVANNGSPASGSWSATIYPTKSMVNACLPNQLDTVTVRCISTNTNPPATPTSSVSLQIVNCPAPICGNGALEYGEVCDDGNSADCDGCRGDCSAVEGSCGDGVFDPICEVCDDGDLDPCTDSCDSTCSGPPANLCGDGILECEQCDDLNTVSGDGCSAWCTLETPTSASFLYSIDRADTTNPKLVKVWLADGSIEVLGSLGYDGVLSVSYLNGTLYAFDNASGELLTLDPTTGVGTPVGVNRAWTVLSMEADPPANDLVAFNWGDQSLYRIDLDNNTTQLIGYTGFSDINALARSSSGDWVGYSTPNRKMVSFDIATGTGTLLPQIVGIIRISGMSFSATDDLIGVQESGTINYSWLLDDTGTALGQIIGTIDSSTLSGAAINPLCGNGTLDPGEMCDDGNLLSGDGCRSDCLKIEACGDGAVDLGESCDDGDLDDCTPACNATCTGPGIVPVCGDGVAECGEFCDDGDTDPCTSGCNQDCSGAGIASVCGDGVIECFEACDDGDTDNCTTGCDATCSGPHTVSCGDGVAECGEFCDDGDNDECTPGCNADCTAPGIDAVCGDGVTECSESCDDGGANGTTSCGCQGDCSYPATGTLCGQETECKRAPYCSSSHQCVPGSDRLNGTPCGTDDGLFCNGVPSCVDGSCTNSGFSCINQERCDESNDVCITCGDGVLSPGEACDDGNTVGGDGCTPTCVNECATTYEVPLAGTSMDVAVDPWTNGVISKAYVVNHANSQVHVVDVSGINSDIAPQNINEPISLNNCTATSGRPWVIKAYGGFLYVGCGENGFRIIKISDPYGQESHDVVPAGGPFVEDFLIEESSQDILYVAAGNYGLLIYDISTPSIPPILLANFTRQDAGLAGGSTHGLEKVGNYVLMADSRGVVSVNVSNPVSPTLGQVYMTPGYSYDLDATGNFVFSVETDSTRAYDSNGVRSFYVSGSGNISELGWYHHITYEGGARFEIEAVENRDQATNALITRYAFMSFGDDGTIVVDVTDPTNPTPVVGYSTSERQGGISMNHVIQANRRWLYRTVQQQGLSIIDLESCAICGNGVVEVGEVCDDNNLNPCDGCSETCLSSEICGNGIQDCQEACDDGGLNGQPNQCSSSCDGPTPPFCGNGAVEFGEFCDDGAFNGTDGFCAPDCSVVQICGNGALEGTEVCDDGVNNGAGEGFCNVGCGSNQQCGDGIVDGTETCDDGGDNGQECKCNFDCTYYPINGDPCGNQGDPCHLDDACDGSGSCVDNGYEPAFTECGVNNDCELNLCDTTGNCINSILPDGAACYDCPSGPPCSYCNGSGACQDCVFDLDADGRDAAGNIVSSDCLDNCPPMPGCDDNPDHTPNCYDSYNPDQRDWDRDGIGDDCTTFTPGACTASYKCSGGTNPGADCSDYRFRQKDSDCLGGGTCEPDCYEDFNGQVQIYRTHSLAIGIPHPQIHTVVIVQHGRSRSASKYWEGMVRVAIDNGTINNTAIIAPRWHTLQENPPGNRIDPDCNAGDPNTPLCIGGSDLVYDPVSNDLRDWATGGSSVSYNGSANGISTYTVMDNIITRIVSNGKFPNLEKIVFEGFSAGGQFATRYSLTTSVDNGLYLPVPRIDGGSDVSVRYVVAAPSTYTFIDEWRPQPNPAGTCNYVGNPVFVDPGDGANTNLWTACPNCSGGDTWDDYKYGLGGNLVPYIDADLLNQYRTRFANKDVYYIVGGDDIHEGALDQSCPANMQGEHRVNRSEIFHAHLARHYGVGGFMHIIQPSSEHPVDRIGHDHNCLVATPQSIEMIMEVDSFYERVDRVASDILGYDHPYPNDLPYCGDSHVNGNCGEECDDGDHNNADGCIDDCTCPDANCASLCGNGINDSKYEECDDGASNGSPGCCDATCDTRPDCGDGTVEGCENCDDGADNGDPGCCTDTCRSRPDCGDGTVEGCEFCDDGANNGSGSGFCNGDCSAIVP